MLKFGKHSRSRGPCFALPSPQSPCACCLHGWRHRTTPEMQPRFGLYNQPWVEAGTLFRIFRARCFCTYVFFITVVKIHNKMDHFHRFLSVQFRGIKHVHITVQRPPPSTSGTFQHPRLKLSTHLDNNTPFPLPQTLASTIPLSSARLST